MQHTKLVGRGVARATQGGGMFATQGGGMFATQGGGMF